MRGVRLTAGRAARSAGRAGTAKVEGGSEGGKRQPEKRSRSCATPPGARADAVAPLATHHLALLANVTLPLPPCARVANATELGRNVTPSTASSVSANGAGALGVRRKT